MTWPEHYLLQFGGTLGEAEEIWSCGIRCVVDTPVPGDGVDAVQYLDDTAVPALSSWIARSESWINLYARLSFAKFNAIGADGRYQTRTETNEVTFTPVPGSKSVAPSTFQVSLAITWETDVDPTQLASRGRIYSPLPAVPINGADCRFNTSYATDVAGSAAQLIEDLTVATGFFEFGQVRPSVVSGVRGGDSNPIVAASVDNRLDVIRTRANAIPGTRLRAEVGG